MSKNNRYINSDASSIFNVKQNVNQFLTDFADIDFNNVIENNKFNNLFPNGVPSLWSSVGVSGTYSNGFASTFSANGYITQNIEARLKPNTNYTVVFYGSAQYSVPAGARITLSVSANTAYQIFNLNDPNEINSASTIINSPTSGVYQKHVLHFKTNPTVITGTINIKLQSFYASPMTLNTNGFICYGSLIELGDLPPYKELPIQSGINISKNYIQMNFNNQGVAVSGNEFLSPSAFNQAITGDDFVTLNGVETLTNKTFSDYITAQNYKTIANSGVYYGKTTGLVDKYLIGVNTNNQVQIGNTSDVIISGNLYVYPTNSIYLPYNTPLYGLATDGITPIPLIEADFDEAVNIGSSTSIVKFGSDIYLRNNKTIFGKSQNGTTDHTLIKIGTNDSIYIGSNNTTETYMSTNLRLENNRAVKGRYPSDITYYNFISTNTFTSDLYIGDFFHNTKIAGAKTTFGEFQSNPQIVIGSESVIGSSYILMGNQSGSGTNKPVVIKAQDGYLQIGHGDSWVSDSNGGTFYPYIETDDWPNFGNPSTDGSVKINRPLISQGIFTTEVSCTGIISAQSFYSNSSLRYKYNVNTITNSLDTTDKLRGVTYNLKADDAPQIGLIAEEVYEVLPELVALNENNQPDGIRYSNLVALLIENVKDLRKEMNLLKSELEILKGI